MRTASVYKQNSSSQSWSVCDWSVCDALFEPAVFVHSSVVSMP